MAVGNSGQGGEKEPIVGGRPMQTERDLRARLRKIEALFAGAGRTGGSLGARIRVQFRHRGTASIRHGPLRRWWVRIIHIDFVQDTRRRGELQGQVEAA
jgi:hypothetical protein